MQHRKEERGAVLVASLIVLALLSLMGAASLMNATLDTKLSSNQAVSKEAFYAAEAALDIGVSRVMRSFREELQPLVPDALANWTTPSTAAGDPFTGAFNGYTVEFRVTNTLDPSAPASAPEPYRYTTVENAQELIHFAYSYTVEGRATGPNGSETLQETIRGLETPLVQYFAFFEDHLSFHNGPNLNAWGRVHTNGNLYLASGEIHFQDYDAANQVTLNTLSAHGVIVRGNRINEGTAAGPKSTGDINVRVRNPGTVPAAAGDYELIDVSITPSNQGAQEARFVDTAGVAHVRIGVDRMPSASYQTLARGGFYEDKADSPSTSTDTFTIDAFKIAVEGGNLKVYFTQDGAVAPTDVTSLVENYQVDAFGPTTADIDNWSAGARTNADGSTASTAAPPIARTMVYSPESPVATDEAANTYDDPATDRTDINPSYPCILEREDPREEDEVDLTVIDLQRLQHWYDDYLDYLDDGDMSNDSVDLTQRQLLIYTSRSNVGGGFLTGTGANLQAIKLIGSRAGRTRTAADRQTSDTLTVRTTLATDNPLYLDGDFNAPNASGGNNNPGSVGGCALLSDASTMLSNSYGPNYNMDSTGTVGGEYTKLAATETAWNAAMMTGRYDFRQPDFRGQNVAAAGIHNFPRFVEAWSGVGAYVSGCLINLWFSQQADADFACCGTGTSKVYSAPQRNFGWDVQFKNDTYWPPFVPSVYSAERAAWQEQ